MPKFDNPPVIETVLGVEFTTLTKWQIPHFGLFWQKVRSDYPQFEVQPYLVSDEHRRRKEELILKKSNG